MPTQYKGLPQRYTSRAFFSSAELPSAVMLSAAAGDKEKRDNDYPDYVVIVKKIAKAVVHSEPPK